MDMLEIPVTLIVKAPNQQVEDQTIHCSLSWTIRRLKSYLSEVYPSKPNTEDQRLIYYGQLLSDSVTLKDVFTRYEASEETHTVHLVCMPSKELLKRRARTMADDERREATPPSVPAAPAAEERLAAGGASPAPQPRVPYPPYGDRDYMQQWAVMQQVYTNYYLSQYMDMMARQGVHVGYADHRQRVARGAADEAQPGQPPQPVRAAPAAADGHPEEDDNPANRDWLDYFYIMSRLLVLFSIVYFYSSPARFVIVSVLGIIMYLYQVGFFRLHQLQAFENNNEVANNNMGEGAPAAGPVPVPAAAAEAAEAARVDARPPEDQDTPSAAPASPPERPSFIAVTWTFLTSFFASMIPETQNAI